MTAPVHRPYQADVIGRLRAAVGAGCRRPLLVAPTGSGKTIIAADIVKGAVDKGKRVLFLAHRRELIFQAHAKLFDLGIDAGIIQAGYPMRPNEPVQIASIQTLSARALRTNRIELPSADIVVVDEAHHARARTYGKILAAYPEAAIVGMSATPCRGDGRGLGNIFDGIIETPSVRELIDLGYLVPTKVYAPVTPNLEGVKVERGDYVEAQLAERMDDVKLIGDIVEHWLRLSERRKTVVFATSVVHSVHLRDEFRRAGVLAEHIDGGTPIEERDAILASLSRGTTELVTNCAVLTEGWDQPDVSCIVLARPTKSMALYRQMVGRVLRPAPGKTDASVLDHAGAVFEHGFVDEPIIWTLDEDKRAENPVHRGRASGRARSLATCPECKAVRIEGQPCPSCGWRPAPKAAPIVVAAGELGRVDRALKTKGHTWTPAEMAKFHRQLLWIAAERERKPGWAAYAYKEKFKTWPAERNPQPEIPDAAVRSWVKSRDIAYAKAKDKERSNAA